MITLDVLIQRAEFLSKQEAEIEWREGIKQAYYYVFHSVSAFTKEYNIGLDVSHDNLGEHQFLIEKIKSIDSRLAKSLAKDIQRLKDKRTLSCYYLDDNVTKMMAFQQVLEAKRVIERLDSLSSSLQ